MLIWQDGADTQLRVIASFDMMAGPYGEVTLTGVDASTLTAADFIL
ncbi:hypothetical protein [Octadecabacter sp. SW4]|nr:hypothetical protein [Octadecabacter sp. SW4]